MISLSPRVDLSALHQGVLDFRCHLCLELEDGCFGVLWSGLKVTSGEGSISRLCVETRETLSRICGSKKRITTAVVVAKNTPQYQPP